MSDEYNILGVNRRMMPYQINPFRGIDYIVVLVGGDIGDYAAYEGVGTEQWVAAYGNKLRFNEAQCHFCNGLDRAKYRE